MIVSRMGGVPSLHGWPRIQERGDCMSVCFRAHRGGLIFLAVWLVFWTYAGAMAIEGLARGASAFVAVWLCGWLLGEVFVSSVVAWKLFGRETLIATANGLEIRRQIGRFAFSEHVPVLGVDSIRATVVPVDEDERPRSDFCLEISAGNRKIRAGHSMSESGAEHLASVVTGRVSPWSGLSEQRVDVWSRDHEDPGESETGPVRLWWQISTGPARLNTTARLAVLCSIGVVLVAVSLVLRHANRGDIVQTPPPYPVPATEGPARSAFHDPSAYAVAATRYALRRGTTLEGTPVCEPGATWYRWTCRATGTELLGPYAGQRLTYRCSPNPWPKLRPYVLHVDCNPDLFQNIA